MGAERSKHKVIKDPELLPVRKTQPSLERKISKRRLRPRPIGSSLPQRRPSFAMSRPRAVQEEPKQHRMKPKRTKPAKDKLKPLAQQTGLQGKPSKRRKNEPKRHMQKKEVSQNQNPVWDGTWRAAPRDKMAGKDWVHVPSKEFLSRQYLARDLKDCVPINLNQVYAEHTKLQTELTDLALGLAVKESSVDATSKLLRAHRRLHSIILYFDSPTKDTEDDDDEDE